MTIFGCNFVSDLSDIRKIKKRTNSGDMKWRPYPKQSFQRIDDMASLFPKEGAPGAIPRWAMGCEWIVSVGAEEGGGVVQHRTRDSKERKK